MAVYESMEELIGATPLVRLGSFCAYYGTDINLYGKLEMFNPSGSAKDRAALYMINAAEKAGLVRGGMIIEPTSGNTGIGLAAIGARRGYRVVLVMPDTMSRERIRLISAYGAEVVLTPGKDGMKGCIEKAEQLKRDNPGSVIIGQFDNPANPKAHECTTGPEIYADLRGNVGAFVAGAGTGGTFTGVARYLKAMDERIKLVTFEPASSPLLTEGRSGAHGLQGIGANFVPRNLDVSLADEIVTVTDEEAFEAARVLCRTEGLLCGITSGAALAAAMKSCKGLGKKPVVALLPDSGDRYLSTGIYANAE